MNSPRTLHRRAMELLKDADIARTAGEVDRANQLRDDALGLESGAAEMLASRLDIEPTRSMLYRGAAIIAFEAGQPRVAEQMAAAGLTGNPPQNVADDLRRLIEKVNTRYPLDVFGDEFERVEIPQSLEGPIILPDCSAHTLAGRSIRTRRRRIQSSLQ